MTWSNAGLDRLARAIEFERLASTLDAGRFLLAHGDRQEAYSYFLEALENCSGDLLLLDWFKHEIAEIMSNEVEAVIAD